MESIGPEHDERPVVLGGPVANIGLAPGGGHQPVREPGHVPQLQQGGIQPGQGRRPVPLSRSAPATARQSDPKVAARPEHAQGQLAVSEVALALLEKSHLVRLPAAGIGRRPWGPPKPSRSPPRERPHDPVPVHG